MLFSCLVDADFLETERFYAEAKGAPVERGGHLDLDTLRESLRAYMARLRAEAASTPLNALRAEVLDRAVERAALSPGLFTLTVPTGGGKTLASLSFALEHAVRHGLRRVVYVIPFTSIIEQTAEVFRQALNTSEDVLEHHASFDWERAAEARRDDGEGPDGLAKLRRAAENWDVPIVVTTAVQFFESLFAARTSRCRKLHNLAGSVIVLDEAQTLADRRCCARAWRRSRSLAANYNASAVLCTATQPALRQQDGFKNGFPIDDTRELAPEPKAPVRAPQAGKGRASDRSGHGRDNRGALRRAAADAVHRQQSRPCPGAVRGDPRAARRRPPDDADVPAPPPHRTGRAARAAEKGRAGAVGLYVADRSRRGHRFSRGVARRCRPRLDRPGRGPLQSRRPASARPRLWCSSPPKPSRRRS